MILVNGLEINMNIPKNSYIVFQAYGNIGILQECAFALLTLSRQHTYEELKDLEIWIYTDKPEFFQSFKGCSLNLNYRGINPVLIQQWRGAINFVHRVKIEVLRDFVKDKEGQVLYLDTDVYIAQPISEVFNQVAEGNLYMHIMEGLIHETDNVVMQKLSRFIKKNKPISSNEKIIGIPEHTAMWNAGLLGFHTKFNYLLEEVLSFTDTVYPSFPKHVVEQFAFSLYFQQAMPMKTAHTRVFHYWNLKEIRFILNSFFKYFEDQNWDILAHYSRLIQLPDAMQQKVNFLQNRTALEKFMKKHWKPQEPRWDLLVQQL